MTPVTHREPVSTQAGAMPESPAEPEPSALEVLQAGRCTPQCMLGREPRGCTCRCGGEYHGTLLGAEVTPVTGAAR